MTGLYFICITFCYLTCRQHFFFSCCKNNTAILKEIHEYFYSFFQKQPNKQSIIKANRYYYEKIVQSYKRMYSEKRKKGKVTAEAIT